MATILVLDMKKTRYFICFQAKTIACSNSHYLIPWKKENNFHIDVVISFHPEFGDLIPLSLQVQLGDLLANNKKIQPNNSPFILVLRQAKPSVYLEH